LNTTRTAVPCCPLVWPAGLHSSWRKLPETLATWQYDATGSTGGDGGRSRRLPMKQPKLDSPL
jgi:hypothetical protein